MMDKRSDVYVKPRQDFSIATFKRILDAVDAAGFDWRLAFIERPAKRNEDPHFRYYDLGIRVRRSNPAGTWEGLGQRVLKAICERTECTEDHFKLSEALR